MPVKDPGKRRSTALAVAIVFALSGGGAAAAWAAGEPAAQARDAAAQLAPSAVSPSPSPSPSPPGRPDKAQGKARELHSESVVKKADGSFEKRVTQIGTVESVSDNAITVKSEDGFSQEYAISADTRIRKVPAASAADPAPKDSLAPKDSPAPKDDAGKRLKPSAATAADLKQGDTVRIMGVQDGSAVTATIIVDGAANGKGLGKGLGQSLGKGLGQGQGKGLGRDNGQGNGRGQGRDDAEDGT
jgi:hypothetical protein